MEKTRRICIFAHFDRDNKIDDYVLYYLRDLQKVAAKIIFVSTAILPGSELNRLKKICSQVILRANQGYDFGSWQRGLEESGMIGYDELILCNDSVYGPFFPLEGIFHEMAGQRCDFWGITDSHEIQYHLQSYFLVFRQPIIRSEIFQRFWKQLGQETNKHQIIRRFEIGLSQLLLDAGFASGVYVRYLPSRLAILNEWLRQRARLPYISGRKRPYHLRQLVKSLILRVTPFNPLHSFWQEIIIENAMPFIKIELLHRNPLQIRIGDYQRFIRIHSSYPVELIERHQERLRETSEPKHTENLDQANKEIN